MVVSRIFASGVLLLAATTAPVRANINFNLIPDPGTSQQAIAGFTAAANLWSTALADNITVNIEIGFTSLGGNVIGSTSSDFREFSYPTIKTALYSHRHSIDDSSSFEALQSGATYNRLINHTSNDPNAPDYAKPYVDTMNRVGITTANAKALGLLGTSSSLDAIIRFSSDFPFDFNHVPGGIAGNKIDFVGAAAHEIGHVLGFISGVEDIDTSNNSGPGGDFSSNMIDLFRYSAASVAAGVGYTDYTAGPTDKYFSVHGGNSMDGAFSTGVVFGDGAQASHWKDNQGIGIMDPTGNFGEYLQISETDLRAFDVLGYTLVPEPGSFALLALGGVVFLVRKLVAGQRAR